MFQSPPTSCSQTLNTTGSPSAKHGTASSSANDSCVWRTRSRFRPISVRTFEVDEATTRSTRDWLEDLYGPDRIVGWKRISIVIIVSVIRKIGGYRIKSDHYKCLKCRIHFKSHQNTITIQQDPPLEKKHRNPPKSTPRYLRDGLHVARLGRNADPVRPDQGLASCHRLPSGND